MIRIIRYVAGLFLFLVLAGLAAIALYVWRSLPPADARLTVAGLQGPVTIDFDQEGVPSVAAHSEADLAFATGFLHARDRLWQLEMHRRIGRGELAEVLGPKALETDKFLRTLGIHRAASAQFARFPEEDKAIFRAYAAGVNAWRTAALTALPPEFQILNTEPGLWTPEDSVAWVLMMAWDLGGNWGNELLRLQLAARMPTERVNELVPAQDGDRLPAHTDFAALYKALGAFPLKLSQTPAVAQEPQPFLSDGIEGIGSNNWVVHGSRTVSGKPLLANDPHLALAAPAIWYFARFKAPGLEVAGATLPGVPGVVLGRTQGVAWGFTNTAPDVQDLYLEEFNGLGQARTPQGWEAVKTRQETIRVKGAEPVTITVRETRHGPVISDHHAPSAAAINGVKYGLALRWTALDADNTTALAARRMNRAQTVAEVIEALKLYVAPMQNVLIADTQGRSAFIAAGRVPLRSAPNDLMGLAPAPGWEPRYDWAGWLDFGQLPQEEITTFRATANQRVHGEDYPHFITGEWAHPGRKRRIEALLEAKPKHDVASLQAIQHDVIHTHDTPLLDWLDRVSIKHPLAEQAKRLLASFAREKKVDADSDSARGALIYWTWNKHAVRLLFEDDIGESLFKAIYGRRSFHVSLNRVAATGAAHWCDDQRTPAQENCVDIFGRALAVALDELVQNWGRDPARWRWDVAHTARSEHRPFSNVDALRGLFEIRTPTAGDTFTVMVGKLHLRGKEPMMNDFAASLRVVYDLAVADAQAASFIYSTGQSGNPFSRLYRNMSERWGSGGPMARIPLQAGPRAGRWELLPKHS